MCIQYTYIFILYSLHPDIPSISPYSIISPKQCQHSYHNTWPWGKSYSRPRPVQYPTAWLIDIFSDVQRRQDRQVHLNESKSNTRIYLGNPSSVTSFLYDSVRCRTYTGTPVSSCQVRLTEIGLLKHSNNMTISDEHMKKMQNNVLAISGALLNPSQKLQK